MEKLQIAEGVASQSLEEEGRSCLPLTASEGGFTPSTACMMGARTLTERSKQGSRQLSTASLVAMACGFGGYVTYRGDNDILATNFKLQLTDSLVHDLLPRLILPVFSRDRSHIAWGRRRPFILGGVLSTIFAATTLAWSEPISVAVCTLLGISNANGWWGTVTRTVAILAIVILNISIQPLQLGLRSLHVDICPREQQAIASAWAGRFAGMGNIIGYVLGSLPLPWISGDYEAMRFRYMIYWTTFALIATSLITCYYTEEEDPLMSTYDPGLERPVYRVFRNLLDGFSQASNRVRHVYLIQFFSWLGWFGFLFYSTSFIGQLYVDEQARDNVTISSSIKDHGMRLGARANLLFAIVALATNIALPRLSEMLGSMCARARIHDKGVRSSSMLTIIWSFSQALYATSVLSTTLVSSSATATFMIAIAGISWGVTQWVPFAIIGEETAKYSIDEESAKREDENVWSVVQGGTIIGLHNTAISLPQIIAALISSAIFWVAQNLNRKHAIVWVIGWTGVPGAVAAWLAFIM
ncbi:hypothetical protein IG631_18815 [Alternaria alternata]|nr:hypothetical protein IG631_18815 [Alternaria alternata]